MFNLGQTNELDTVQKLVKGTEQTRIRRPPKWLKDYEL